MPLGTCDSLAFAVHVPCLDIVEPFDDTERLDYVDSRSLILPFAADTDVFHSVG